MLNKRNLQVAQFASKEESRYTLKAIQVTPEATIATDGHRLVIVSRPTFDESSFPVVDGFEGPCHDGATFLLDVDAAKAIEKAIPKRSTIPILNNAAVRVNSDGDGGVKLSIAVTDLENPQVFRPKPVSRQYPNWQAVMPADAPKFQIAVSAEYLAQIARFAAAFTNDNHRAVVMSFYGDDRAMRFDVTDTTTGQGMTAVLMPIPAEAIVPGTMPGTYGYAAWKAEQDATKEAEAIAETNALADE